MWVFLHKSTPSAGKGALNHDVAFFFFFQSMGRVKSEH